MVRPIPDRACRSELASFCAPAFAAAIVFFVVAFAGCDPEPIMARRGSTGGGGAQGSPDGGALARSSGSIDASSSDTGGAAERPKLPSRDAGRDAIDEAAGGANGVSGRPPVTGELVVDEALVNPAGDDLGREWIELENRSDAWLDLANLHLANGSTDIAVSAGALAPGGLRVLGQSSDPGKNGGAAVDVAYGTKLILANADGRLSICVGACASGVALQTIAWGPLTLPYTGHAIVFDTAGQPSCPADQPFGTAGSYGTPGRPNPPCVSGSTDAGAAATSDGDTSADVSVAD